MSASDQDAGATPGTQSGPGPRLSAAREAQGTSLAGASEAVGVPEYVLRALEADDWETLGAPVYVRGYLRKYARLLQLPEDEVVAAYETAAAPHDPDVRAHATRNVPHRHNARWLAPATAGAIAILLALAAIWGWHRIQRHSGRGQVPAAAVSAMMGITRTAPAQASRHASGSLTHDAPAVASSDAAALPGTGLGTGAPAAGTSALVLSITAPSWVEVYGSGHKRLYYNLAAVGQKLRFGAGEGPFEVFLGNADGVGITFKDKPVSIPASDRSGKTARLTVGVPKPPAPGTAP